MLRPTMLRPIMLRPFTSSLFALTLGFSCIALAEDKPTEVPKTEVKAEAAKAETVKSETKGSKKPESADASKLAATFDSQKITIGNVDAEIKRQPLLGYQLSLAKDDPAKVAQVRFVAVNAIVERKLLITEAKKAKALGDEEVTKSVAEFIKTNYGGDKELTGMLKSIGTSLTQFKSDVADDFRIKAFLEKSVLKDIVPSEDDIKKAYDANPERYAQKESVHARHIIVRVDPTASDADKKAAEEKINAIYTDATKPGADFAEIAKKESQDGAAAQGGDLGFFTKGRMVPEFEQAAFALKPGEVSKPLKTQFGYHIIKVEEHKDGAPPSFETAKEQVAKEVSIKKRNEVVKAKLEEMKKSANLKILIPAS